MTKTKAETATDGLPRLRSFGRIVGRPLSKRQRKLWNALLPEIEVKTGDSAGIRPRDLGLEHEDVWLEIGFGGGEHLVEQARRHPDVGIIGSEPYEEGVAKLLTQIDEHNLKNVRVHPWDARELLDQLEEGSLSRVFILFPDPWPKKRHWKRRLIQPSTLDGLHRVMSPGATLRFATDVKGYADEALATFISHGGFDWPVRRADDWRVAPADHIATRYEIKRLGDCAPVWFDFVRL